MTFFGALPRCISGIRAEHRDYGKLCHVVGSIGAARPKLGIQSLAIFGLVKILEGYVAVGCWEDPVPIMMATFIWGSG